MAYEALDIFEHLHADEVQWLLATSEFRTVEPGTYILREGDPAANIFFVADGLFDVSVYSGEGASVSVGRLGPGDVIGEMSWLDRKSASGSVKAVETGMVMCVQTAVLDAKLASDPIFAAHFLRAVATLVVQRLRKTNLELRRSASGVAAWVGSGQRPLAVAIAKFKSCAADVQANPDKDGALLEAFKLLEGEVASAAAAALLPETAEAIRQELRAHLRTSSIGARCIDRPRGYVADYATIDQIFMGQPTGQHHLGTTLDRCLLDMAGVKAIGRRLRMIAEMLRGQLQASNKSLLVTNLGSGAAPEILELLADGKTSGQMHVTCIDVDREALARLEQRVAGTLGQHQVHAVHANLIHLATGRDDVDLEPQDVIYSAGLLDVLKDDAAVALINWMYGKLKPGGKLIIGSFNPGNPSLALMEYALDWPLQHRSEAAMRALLVATDFAQAPMQVTRDESTPCYLTAIAKPEA